VVFLSALLKRADELLSAKIHPNIIIHGYNLATNKALEIIDKQAVMLDGLSGDILDVVDCGRNLLTSHLRSMIREAYLLASWDGKFEKENVRFLKKTGGNIQESSLIKGVVIKKEKAHPNMPDRIRNLRIAITSESPGINRLDIKMRRQGPPQIKLSIQHADQMRKFKEAETKIRTDALEKMLTLKANVLLCEQPLGQSVKDKLFLQGIFALESVDKTDSQAVARATGATIVGQLSKLVEEDLGVAEELYTGKIELEKTVTIQGCRGATFMLRGSEPQAIDELETAIRNSLVVLKIMDGDGRVLVGGGAAEAQIAEELKSFAMGFPSKEQVAIESFGAALMEIPRCLAENYGLNPTDVLLQLKNQHANGLACSGVGENGRGEMVCLEPARVKRSVIRRANEVSALMLRIDELMISKEIAKFHKK